MQKLFLVLCLMIFSTYTMAAPVKVEVVSSGSYTVPARKWAKVDAECTSGGELKLNSERIIKAGVREAVSLVGATDAAVNYSVPAGLFFTGVSYQGSASGDIPNVAYTTYHTNRPSGNLGVPKAGAMLFSAIKGINHDFIPFYIRKELSLVAGSVLNITGSCRLLIQLYER